MLLVIICVGFLICFLINISLENSADQHAQQAEATVIYHIYQAACSGYKSVTEFLASLKNMTKAPEMILNPFFLGVLLSVLTVSGYEQKIFDLIKSCTSRVFQEDDLKKNSYWIREMIPQNVNLDLVFSQVIDVR